MTEAKTGMLKVAGASLYYQVRGAGPLLLILQGGAGDGDCSDGIANDLAGSYTVATYDRRGLSRSTLDEMPETLRLEVHSEDAHRLLAELTSEPALVFGSSIGALIGLDLAARHPEQVRALVAHEPPAYDLLSDAEREQAERTYDEIQEAFRREDVAAAMKTMVAVNGVDFNDCEPDVQLPPLTGGAAAQASAQRAANLRFLLAYDFLAVRRYRLDMAALKAAAYQIVPAAGRTSQGAWPHHAAAELAERLGTELVEFPGGHTGYVLRPKAFAQRLREVLGRMRPRRAEDFDASYAGTPPWDIGRPQPAFLALAESGAIRGRVLDVGCGTGEHVLMAAGMGLDATGIDTARSAIALAEAKARDRGVSARFQVWDALQSASLDGPFDTVLDCGLFHVFGDADRLAFADNLRAAIPPGGRYFMLCFSDRQPGLFGPRRVSQDEIRASFAEGWRVDQIEPARLETRIGPEGILAWLARITRT